MIDLPKISVACEDSDMSMSISDITQQSFKLTVTSRHSSTDVTNLNISWNAVAVPYDYTKQNGSQTISIAAGKTSSYNIIFRRSLNGVPKVTYACTDEDVAISISNITVGGFVITAKNNHSGSTVNLPIVWNAVVE